MTSFQSKLPQSTTSIFSVMSALANQQKAVNLSQGFPDFPVSQKLKQLVSCAIDEDYNQYAPMTGVPELRFQIAKKINTCYGYYPDPEEEITITTGASQAICSAITMLVSDGDEVIVLEPAYDSYIPSVLVNGGIPVVYEMIAPDFKVDWNNVEGLVSAKTKLIIINNPHNPTGTLLDKDDLDALERIVLKYGLFLLSDEVYEHLVYDGIAHQSVLIRPALRSRSLVTFSFGKTFHATGWKVGYIIAPGKLTYEFRKIHQFTVFSVNTPVQYALANYIKEDENWQMLSSFYQEKRDYLTAGMHGTPFTALQSKGTYFQLYDYSGFSSEKDMEFAKWLTREIGVATIPLSPFYTSNRDQKLIRICFAKQQSTLERAINLFKNL